MMIMVRMMIKIPHTYKINGSSIFAYMERIVHHAQQLRKLGEQ